MKSTAGLHTIIYKYNLTELSDYYFILVRFVTQHWTKISIIAWINIEKETRCLGSGELVYEKRFKTICYKVDMVRKMF